MFGLGKSTSAASSVSANNVETLIGKTSVLKGTINSENSLRIDGVFEGSVISQGDVFIGASGRVTADICARNVTISGHVVGNVSVDEKLELLVGATLNGDIKVKKLVIEEGAEFKGISETKNEPGKTAFLQGIETE